MHYSDVMVIVCGDDRYSPGGLFALGFHKILSRERAECRFQISGFGASLEFSQLAYLTGWQKRIITARALHIKRVVLIDHVDCGAFAEEFGQMSKEAEVQKHLETLAVARQWFAKNAPEFEFHAYLQDGDKSDKIF